MKGMNKDKLSINNYLKMKVSVINKGISPNNNNNNNNSNNKGKTNCGIHITKVNKGEDIHKKNKCEYTKHTKRVSSNQRNENRSSEKKSYQLSARVNPKYKI